MAEKRQAQMLEDMEIKVKLDRPQLAHILRQWVTSLEQEQALDLKVKNETCTVPFEVWDNAKIELEYEVDEGEMELQLKAKWR